jgi:cyclic pyranopterin phosphate synthase
MKSKTPRFSHLTADGKAAMVDVSHKPVVPRHAVAEGFVKLQSATLSAIRKHTISKGEVLAVARIAGIQAAKHTAQLIPLCHPLPLASVSVEFAFARKGIRVTAQAKTTAQTGVEMEALTAAAIACLTIYDMCKAVDSAMEIGPVRLLLKRKGPPGNSR